MGRAHPSPSGGLGCRHGTSARGSAASRINHANYSEIITAVKVSVKDEITLSVSVAVGSTIVSFSFNLNDG